MADSKLRVLIERLGENSRSGKVHWREGVTPGEFNVSFPNYSIGVREEESGRVLISIYNDSGTAIEILDSDKIPSWDYQLKDVVTQIYENARREAYNVDQALDQIIQQLS